MKLRPRIVGYKEFSEFVDVTDPCYDKDVWCRLNDIKIRAGDYTCVTWMGNKTLVGIIGIYLNGMMPQQDDMKEIGVIGVDAGLAGFFNNKPDYEDKQWHEFCKSIRNGNAWIKDEGFFSSSGHGDGGYPVYAYEQDNEITALEIRFI